MKRYLYTGPVTSVKFKDGTEAKLLPGTELPLDESNKYIKTLQAMGRLKEIPEIQEEVKEVKKKGGK